MIQNYDFNFIFATIKFVLSTLWGLQVTPNNEQNEIIT